MSDSLYIPRGDTARVCVHVVDSDGESIDLSAFALTFRLLRSMQDDVSAAIFVGTDSGGEISFLDVKDGIAEVAIPGSASAVLMIGRPYPWTMTLTNSGNSFTPVSGLLYATIPSKA